MHHVIISKCTERIVGTVYYYESQNDFYDENKACTGEIPVVAITRIESSLDPKCANGCGFEVHARVEQGGDSDGIRTYVFEAKQPDLAKEWMNQLCLATGSFIMKPKKGSAGYESVLSNEAIAERQNQKLRSVMSFASTARVDEQSSPERVQSISLQSADKRSILDRSFAGRGRGFQQRRATTLGEVPKEKTDDLEATLDQMHIRHEEEPKDKERDSLESSPSSKPIISSIGSSTIRRSSLVGEPGRGGGRGRGAAFKEGSGAAAKRLSGAFEKTP